MDDFELELARMMRDTQENTPFEDRYRRRLRAGIHARREARKVWMVTGSALAIVGLSAGLVVLPCALGQGGPTGPRYRPVTSAEPTPMPSTGRPVFTATGVPMLPMPTCTSTAGPVPPYGPSPPERPDPKPHRPSPAEPAPACASTAAPEPMPHRLSPPERPVPTPHRISPAEPVPIPHRLPPPTSAPTPVRTPTSR